jgi:hypothetical protein
MYLTRSTGKQHLTVVTSGDTIVEETEGTALQMSGRTAILRCSALGIVVAQTNQLRVGYPT